MLALLPLGTANQPSSSFDRLIFPSKFRHLFVRTKILFDSRNTISDLLDRVIAGLLFNLKVIFSMVSTDTCCANSVYDTFSVFDKNQNNEILNKTNKLAATEKLRNQTGKLKCFLVLVCMVFHICETASSPKVGSLIG